MRHFGGDSRIFYGICRLNHRKYTDSIIISESEFLYIVLLWNNLLPIRYRHRQSGSTAYRLQARPAPTGPGLRLRAMPALICRLMVATLVILGITWITTHLPTPEGWKAELAYYSAGAKSRVTGSRALSACLPAALVSASLLCHRCMVLKVPLSRRHQSVDRSVSADVACAVSLHFSCRFRSRFFAALSLELIYSRHSSIVDTYCASVCDL